MDICTRVHQRTVVAMNETKSRSFVSAQMVAERAGVSRSAVSRTFTDGASVSEATRRKVLNAAGELGYHVNHLARGLIQDRSNIVCLVVADMTTAIRARMVDALTRRLQAIDKVAMVINTESDSAKASRPLCARRCTTAPKRRWCSPARRPPRSSKPASPMASGSF
jgi:AcrR family transcriptional regulator